MNVNNWFKIQGSFGNSGSQSCSSAPISHYLRALFFSHSTEWVLAGLPVWHTAECATTVKHASISLIQTFVRAHETYSIFLVLMFSLPLTDLLVLFLPFLVLQLVTFSHSHWDIHTRKLLNCFVITFLIALKSLIFNTFLVSFTL